jgi:hypothetical protein
VHLLVNSANTNAPCLIVSHPDSVMWSYCLRLKHRQGVECKNEDGSCFNTVGRNNAVGIANCYGVDGPRDRI